MSQSIYAAASGALVQQMRLSVLSNNLANINTVGFKEDRTVFRAYLPGSAAGGEEPPKTMGLEDSMKDQSSAAGNLFVCFEGTKTNFSQGSVRLTGNSFDMALEGKGFFCVRTPDGIAYTRRGSFTLNDEGVLVTQDGHPVMGEGGEIRPGKREFHVDEDGVVKAGEMRIDDIKVVDFPQPYSMKKVGDTLFVPVNSIAEPGRAEDIKVRQGFVEMSNVVAVRAMTEMIEVLRAYESYQKIIQSIDDCTEKTINEVGRVA
jgi:flagellar basal-body rod protein FlgF